MCNLISDLLCPHFHSRLYLHRFFILQWKCILAIEKLRFIYSLGKELIKKEKKNNCVVVVSYLFSFIVVIIICHYLPCMGVFHISIVKCYVICKKKLS